MATYNYNGVGLRNVGSYMVSGHPFITGSGAYGGVGGMHTMALVGTLGSGSATTYRIGGAGTAADPAEIRVNFPYVSKRILVFASGSGTQRLRVHFDSVHGRVDSAHEGGTGADAKNRVTEGHHFIELDGDEDYWEFSVKTDRIYLSTINQTTGFKVYAELTSIPTGSMYTLTGSGISD